MDIRSFANIFFPYSLVIIAACQALTPNRLHPIIFNEVKLRMENQSKTFQMLRDVKDFTKKIQDLVKHETLVEDAEGESSATDNEEVNDSRTLIAGAATTRHYTTGTNEDLTFMSRGRRYATQEDI